MLLLKVANPKDKLVDNRDETGIQIHDPAALSMEMMFPGLNREREMSAMVSALTHVVSGEVPSGGEYYMVPNDQYHHHHQQQPSAIGEVVTTTNMSSSATPPLSTSTSNYHVASSSLKRSREDDSSSSPAMPISSKHQINSFSFRKWLLCSVSSFILRKHSLFLFFFSS